MASVKIKWLTEGKVFAATDSTNHSVVLSTADEGVGMKPSDLLLVAIGSCTAVDVVNILEKKRKTLTGLDVKVDAEQQSDPPWTFRKIHMHFRVTGEDLTEKDVEQAIELSEEKYCSVSATVRGVAEVTKSFEIIAG